MTRYPVRPVLGAGKHQSARYVSSSQQVFDHLTLPLRVEMVDNLLDAIGRGSDLLGGNLHGSDRSTSASLRSFRR
jgi:hypothetical protein